MATGTRRNIEAECLVLFDQVLTALAIRDAVRGYGASNRFDPSFELVGQQRFQFGDLRVELPDRTVVVEVESGGGLTNLVKYWPFASLTPKPILLLHAFGQGSLNDYISHLRLWDFTWAKMREEIWSRPNPRLFAKRFQYTHGADAAAGCCRRIVSQVPLAAARRSTRQVFQFEPQNTKLTGEAAGG